MHHLYAVENRHLQNANPGWRPLQLPHDSDVPGPCPWRPKATVETCCPWQRILQGSEIISYILTITKRVTQSFWSTNTKVAHKQPWKKVCELMLQIISTNMRLVTKLHCLGTTKTQVDVQAEQSPLTHGRPHRLISLWKRKQWLQIPIVVHQKGIFWHRKYFWVNSRMFQCCFFEMASLGS